MKSIFISGTDTNVGKTSVSSLLLTALCQAGFNAGYFKPVQTGGDLDTLTVSQLTRIPLVDFPQPVYQFSEPLSPHRAAVIHHQAIEVDEILKIWEQKRNDRFWIVEGAGGLLVPLNQKQTISDLVVAMNLSLILVISTRLGTLNHTLLTLEAAKSRGLLVVGLVLVGSGDLELESVLSELTDVPVLTRIPWFDRISDQWVQEQASSYFSALILKQLFGKSV